MDPTKEKEKTQYMAQAYYSYDRDNKSLFDLGHNRLFNSRILFSGGTTAVAASATDFSLFYFPIFLITGDHS